MAKFDEREGNSCHIHMSLRGTDGSVVFADDDGPTDLFRQFVAGVQTTLAEFTLLYAPNINSYKRFAPGSFAPTAVAWGWDNRTCALRAVGHGAGLRIENRLPGGDVNPYLGLAAMLAGGLHGIENTSSSWSRRWRATPTSPTRRWCRTPCATPATPSPPRSIARDRLR